MKGKTIASDRKKVIVVNCVLTLFSIGVAGIAYDYIKYGSFFSKAHLGVLSKQQGERTKNVSSDPDPYTCISTHAYFGYTNHCTQQTSKGFLKEHSLAQNKALKKRGVLRVLITGGSVASHLTRRTSIENALTIRLRSSTELSKLYPGGVAVFNAAQGGYKQPQQLIIIGTLLSAGYQFEGVINVAGFNEIALPLAENYPQQISTILPRSQRLLESKELSLNGAFQNALPILNLHPATRAAAHALIKHNATKGAETSLKPYQFDLPTSEKEAIDQAISIWIKSSQLAHYISSSSGAKYLEYIQPNQYLANSKPLSHKERDSAFSPAGRQPYRRPIEMFYGSIKISDFKLPPQSISDGRMIFYQNRKTLYIDDCCHLNKTGMELLSRDIANHFILLAKKKNNNG